MDRRENLRRSVGVLRGKMHGRTNLHVQSRGLQAVGAARSERENLRAVRPFATHLRKRERRQHDPCTPRNYHAGKPGLFRKLLLLQSFYRLNRQS